MHKIALLFGVLLIGLGLYGYLSQSPTPKSPASPTSAAANDQSSVEPAKRSLTALIPAVFGAFLLLCGWIGSNPKLRKLAMHIAVGFATLGALLGGGRFLSKVGSLFGDDPNVNRRAIIFTGLLALICLIYVLLGIQSFVAARRMRLAKKP